MVRNFIIRLVINAVALAVTAWLLPGIWLTGDRTTTLLIVAFIFGLVNAFIKPIVAVLTCPFVILTLGLFIFVINGLMLLITSALVPDRFMVDGLGTAIIGGIVMGIVAIVVEWVLDRLGFDEDKPKSR